MQFAVQYIKDKNAKFDIFDLRKDTILKKYDYVISSGVFNHSKTTDYQFIKKSLEKMFNACKKGVAVDFMSSYVDYRESKNFYSQPQVIFKLCKSLTKRVILRHDYMPFEFCVYLYKNDSKTESNVFTEFSKDLKN